MIYLIVYREFEFAAGRGLGMNSDSVSEGASILSGSNSMMSTNSSMIYDCVIILPSTSACASRLSPVQEGKHGEKRETGVSLSLS